MATSGGEREERQPGLMTGPPLQGTRFKTFPKQKSKCSGGLEGGGMRARPV